MNLPRTFQDAIVRMCEAWWQSGAEGREALVPQTLSLRRDQTRSREITRDQELVPQTISYLLVRALADGAGATDVKRLWAYRGALAILDWADTSVGAVRKLLLLVAIRPAVLRCVEGRRLLVHAFGLHPPLVADLHRAIKVHVVHVSEYMYLYRF